MAALILPRRFTSQPQQAAPIDWSNPITAGLRNVLIPTMGVRDAVSGENWTTWGTTPTVVATPFGMAFDTTAAFGGFALSPAINVAAGASTQLAVVPTISVLPTSYAGLFGIFKGDATGNHSAIQEFAGSGVWGFFADPSNFTTGLSTATTLNVASTFVLVGDAVNSQLFRNGAAVGAATSATGPQATSKVVVFGERTAAVGFATKAQLSLYAIWTRRLTDAETYSLNRNPWQIFQAPKRRLWMPNAAVQLLAPSSDISAGTWTPSSGGSLFAMLNESVANDATFDVTSQASTFKVGIAAGANPGVTTGHVVRYRIIGSQTVSLMQGVTVIASWSQAPTVMTTFVQAVTSIQAATITDYTTLSLQFQAT